MKVYNNPEGELRDPTAAGTRASVSDYPRLAFFVGHQLEEMKVGDIVELSRFRPMDVTSDPFIATLLRTTSDFLVGYVDALARRDPTAARALADQVQVPWVRKMEKARGAKEIVEVVTLTEYARRGVREVGRLAGEDLAASLVTRKEAELKGKKRP